jgi:FkbM family methyltransferase
MKIIFEVGANNGSDTEKFAADGTVIAFEPEPNLYAGLVNKFAGRDNVFLFPYAIDTENGRKNFYSSNIECGIGSLYELDERILETALKQYECFREGFHNKYEVETMRMDTFLEQHPVPQIDYLWIDAQGNDFKVLQSFGDKLDIVREGRCECTFHIPLYKEVDNSHENVTKFLESKGFKVAVDYVHQHNTEIDLRFWRE